jgi:hypothetical protein
MIKDLKALLDNAQDAMHHLAIYSSTLESIKHKHCNMIYISDEPLHVMELCNNHGIIVEVEGIDGERMSQMCR